jgi:hypothetical protein
VDAISLRDVVRREFQRAFHAPFFEPSVVVINGLLMAGAWFLLPTRWQDALFSLHGSFAFPLILSSWMYSDVPATNVLGADAPHAKAALDDPVALDRLLNARTILLWALVTPICVAIAIGIGIHDSQWARMALTILAIVIPPFGALGVAAWLGIWFPYHPIPLRERWAQRRSFGHMWVRWGALVLLPYAVVPALTVLTVAPAYVLWAAFGKGLNAPLSDAHVAIGGVITLAFSLALWAYGRRVSRRLVRRHRVALGDYLADPTRG